MNEPQVTIVGNLTRDPEVRQAGNSTVVNFTIASTPRTFDRQTNDWKNGETLFLDCSAWREFGEQIAETLQKGSRVIAQGALKQRSFEDKEGNRRTVFELDVQEIGPLVPRTRPNTQRAGSPQQGYQPPQGQAGSSPADPSDFRTYDQTPF